MSGQNEPEESIDEVEEISFTPSYHVKMFEFIDRMKVDSDSLNYYLYKYDDPVKGESKSFIEKYVEQDPPDEDEIGRSFGGGRYILCMTVPAEPGKRGSGKMRGYKFRVHPRYDELKRQSEPVPIVPATGPQLPQFLPLPNQSNGMKEAFGMIKEMMSIFLPLMMSKKEPGIDEIMSGSYAAMNEVMQNSMIQNYKMFQQFTKAALLDQTGDTQEMEDTITQEREPSILEQIGPLLNEWLPKLIGGGPTAAAVGNVVKMTPQFQQIVRDKVELRKVIKYLEETRGPVETGKILTSLGIPYQQIPQPAGQAPTRQPVKKQSVSKKKP